MPYRSRYYFSAYGARPEDQLPRAPCLMRTAAVCATRSSGRALQDSHKSGMNIFRPGLVHPAIGQGTRLERSGSGSEASSVFARFSAAFGLSH